MSKCNIRPEFECQNRISNVKMRYRPKFQCQNRTLNVKIRYLAKVLITKTSPCNEYPLTPQFYTEKVGFTRVYIFFLFLLQNIDCGYSLEPPR